MGHAEYLQAVTGVVVSPGHDVWVRRGTLADEESLIDVFGPDGEYRGTLPPDSPFPARFAGPGPRAGSGNRRARGPHDHRIPAGEAVAPTTLPPSSTTTPVRRPDHLLPVRDHHRRPPPRHLGVRRHHLRLRLRVQRARGLVEHQHRRIGQQRPRDRHALALPRR